MRDPETPDRASDTTSVPRISELARCQLLNQQSVEFCEENASARACRQQQPRNPRRIDDIADQIARLELSVEDGVIYALASPAMIAREEYFIGVCDVSAQFGWPTSPAHEHDLVSFARISIASIADLVFERALDTLSRARHVSDGIVRGVAIDEIIAAIRSAQDDIVACVSDESTPRASVSDESTPRAGDPSEPEPIAAPTEPDDRAAAIAEIERAAAIIAKQSERATIASAEMRDLIVHARAITQVREIVARAGDIILAHASSAHEIHIARTRAEQTAQPDPKRERATAAVRIACARDAYPRAPARDSHTSARTSDISIFAVIRTSADIGRLTELTGAKSVREIAFASDKIDYFFRARGYSFEELTRIAKRALGDDAVFIARNTPPTNGRAQNDDRSEYFIHASTPPSCAEAAQSNDRHEYFIRAPAPIPCSTAAFLSEQIARACSKTPARALALPQFIFDEDCAYLERKLTPTAADCGVEYAFASAPPRNRDSHARTPSVCDRAAPEITATSAFEWVSTHNPIGRDARSYHRDYCADAEASDCLPVMCATELQRAMAPWGFAIGEEGKWATAKSFAQPDDDSAPHWLAGSDDELPAVCFLDPRGESDPDDFAM